MASDLAQAWRRSAPINGQSTPPFSYHTRGRVIDGAEGEDVVAELGETGHRLRHTAPSEDKVAQTQLLALLICLYYYAVPQLLRLLALSSLTAENCSEENPLAIVRYGDNFLTEAIGSDSDRALSKALVPQQYNNSVHKRNNQFAVRRWPEHSTMSSASANDSSQKRSKSSRQPGALDGLYQTYTEWKDKNKGNFYGVTYNDGAAPAFQGNVTGGTQQGPGKSQTFGATEISGNAVHFQGDIPIELAMELLKQQNQQTQTQTQPAGHRLGSAPSGMSNGGSNPDPLSLIKKEARRERALEARGVPPPHGGASHRYYDTRGPARKFP